MIHTVTVYSISFENGPYKSVIGARRKWCWGRVISTRDVEIFPPLVGENVIDWTPSIKHYPHFDKPIRPNDILKLVSDPNRVAKNSFYPFMRFEEKWQPFRSADDGKPPKKTRELRFASRRDAYIYSYYRHLIRTPYEHELAVRGLNENVIAYRKLTSASGKGKSNIEFALDAINAIRNFGHTAVVTLDISKFFESIDHDLLYQKWAGLLNVVDLPPDHAAVFRAITRYAIVDRNAAYERLGFLTWKSKGNSKIPVYSMGFKDMPRQLCTNHEFREKICGKGGKFQKLIASNEKTFGIPQGSPISDMLANLYLIDFDTKIKNYVDRAGGTFFRYSDDIIIIIPGGETEALNARDFAINEIRKHGSEIQIKQSKTSVLVYSPKGDRQSFVKIDGEQGANGLEYLGFRYDGRFAYLKDATLSRLYRKVTRSLRAEARALVRRYPGKDRAFLERQFDLSAFLQKFGRVENFDMTGNYEEWTFWTYAKRALDAFGQLGRPISKQLRNYGLIVRTRMKDEIAKALN